MSRIQSITLHQINREELFKGNSDKSRLRDILRGQGQLTPQIKLNRDFGSRPTNMIMVWWWRLYDMIIGCQFCGKRNEFRWLRSPKNDTACKRRLAITILISAKLWHTCIWNIDETIHFHLINFGWFFTSFLFPLSTYLKLVHDCSTYKYHAPCRYMPNISVSSYLSVRIWYDTWW